MIRIAATLLSSSLILAVINFGTGIFLAKLIGPKDFGIYVSAIVMRDLVGLPFLVSFNLTLSRFRIGWRLNAEASLGGILVGSIFYFIGIVAVSLLGGQELLHAPLAACLWLAVAFVLGAISGVFQGVLQVKNRYSQMVIINFLTVTVISAVSLAGAWFFPGYYVLIFRELVTVACLGLFYWYFADNQLRPRWQVGRLWVMLRFTYKIWLCRMSETVMDRIDRGLISIFMGATWAGQYHQARYLGEVGQLTLTPLSGFFFERLSAFRNGSENKMKTQQLLCRIYLYIGFFVSLLILAFGGGLIILILGNSWGKAAELIPFFSPFVAILPLLNFLKIVLYIQDEALSVFRGHVIQILLTVTCLVGLILTRSLWAPLALAIGSYVFLIILLQNSKLDYSIKRTIIRGVLIGLLSLGSIAGAIWLLPEDVVWVVVGMILGYCFLAAQDIFRNFQILQQPDEVIV